MSLQLMRAALICVAIAAVAAIGLTVPAGTSARLEPVSTTRHDRVAFVAELMDDSSRFSAMFAAHWEAPEKDWAQGPEGVSLAEALKWARANADVVYVQIGGDHEYSAGEEHPDASLPRWPEAGLVVRPRPDGTPPDGTQQRRSWEVRSWVRLTDPPNGAAAALREEIARAGHVQSVAIKRLDDDLIQTRVAFDASGSGAAVVGSEAAVEQALDVTGLAGEVLRSEYRTSWSEPAVNE